MLETTFEVMNRCVVTLVAVTPVNSTSSPRHIPTTTGRRPQLYRRSKTSFGSGYSAHLPTLVMGQTLCRDLGRFSAQFFRTAGRSIHERVGDHARHPFRGLVV